MTVAGVNFLFFIVVPFGKQEVSTGDAVPQSRTKPPRGPGAAARLVDTPGSVGDVMMQLITASENVRFA